MKSKHIDELVDRCLRFAEEKGEITCDEIDTFVRSTQWYARCAYRNGSLHVYATKSHYEHKSFTCVRVEVIKSRRVLKDYILPDGATFTLDMFKNKPIFLGGGAFSHIFDKKWDIGRPLNINVSLYVPGKWEENIRV